MRPKFLKSPSRETKKRGLRRCGVLTWSLNNNVGWISLKGGCQPGTGIKQVARHRRRRGQPQALVNKVGSQVAQSAPLHYRALLQSAHRFVRQIDGGFHKSQLTSLVGCCKDGGCVVFCNQQVPTRFERRKFPLRRKVKLEANALQVA